MIELLSLMHELMKNDDSPINPCITYVFKLWIIRCVILSIKQVLYEIKHLIQSLYAFMMKSISNPCFLSIQDWNLVLNLMMWIMDFCLFVWDICRCYKSVLRIKYQWLWCLIKKNSHVQTARGERFSSIKRILWLKGYLPNWDKDMELH